MKTTTACMRLLTTFTLLTICFTAIGQTTSIDTESKYADSTGKGIIIQNSLPKGGGYLDSIRKIGYTYSNGKNFSYVIFWTTVINETATPLELTINFPADSLAIFPSPDSYLKLLLPPATMTPDKKSMGDYGVTGLKYFLDTSFNKPTKLQRAINPKEECFFYIAALLYQARGTARAGLALKGQDLYYRISIGPQSAIIPCGQLSAFNLPPSPANMQQQQR
jgi:hypothetical protein